MATQLWFDPLAPGSHHHLNPFDLPNNAEAGDQPEHSDRLADHVQKLHTLLEIMLADRTPEGAGKLSSDEKGLLDRALYESYRKVGITKERTTHHRPAPLMRDLYEVLASGVCGPDTHGLTQRLRRYVHGSLAGLFAGQTNISLDRMIITFDIYDLETELRPIGLFLVSNFVWTQSFQSKIPRQLIVDEAATLTQYESGAIFLEDLVRRARKHYLGVTVISQHARIFEHSSIPANCATHVLMRQDATSLDLLVQMFKLSSREAQLLCHLGKGEALLITNEKRLPIRFAASDVEHLLATTDPREIAQWQEEHAQTAGSEQAKLLQQLQLAPPQPPQITSLQAQEEIRAEEEIPELPPLPHRSLPETKPLQGTRPASRIGRRVQQKTRAEAVVQAKASTASGHPTTPQVVARLPIIPEIPIVLIGESVDILSDEMEEKEES
jgi:hypothetical protein